MRDVSSPKPYAQGGNYIVEIENRVAVCRVFRRLDLDSATGARFAEEKIAIAERLAATPAAEIAGFVLDLRLAPPVVGPATEGFLRRILQVWETARRPMAVVVSDHPTQVLQFGRLVREHAPTMGRTVPTEEAASAWVVHGRR